MKDQIESDELEKEDIVAEEVAEEEEPTTDEANDNSDVSEDDDDQNEDGEEGEEPDALIVEIAGEEDPDEVPVIRTLRQKTRDDKKKIKELEQKLAAATSQEEVVELGPKPKLEEFDYDEDKFAEALTGWTARKSEIDAQKEEKRKADERMTVEWNERVAEYNERKQKLGAHDFDDAEDAVKAGLSLTQQSIIVEAAASPEVMVYAVGKNPSVMERLSKIDNPIRFAAEVGRLESKMKVSNMKSRPVPEKRPAASTAPKTGKAQLQKLRETAERTGDFTDYYAAKRKAKG